MIDPNNGIPRIRSSVPSIGSRIQLMSSVALTHPDSSPVMPCSGYRISIIDLQRRSISRSTLDAGPVCPLDQTRNCVAGRSASTTRLDSSASACANSSNSPQNCFDTCDRESFTWLSSIVGAAFVSARSDGRSSLCSSHRYSRHVVRQIQSRGPVDLWCAACRSTQALHPVAATPVRRSSLPEPVALVFPC